MPENTLHERIQALDQFGTEPEKFQSRMRELIRTNLAEADTNELGPFCVFAFRYPQDSHLVPLFERIMFDELVQYHNSNSTADRYVSPDTLMNFDQEFQGKRHQVGEKEIVGETALSHELRHAETLQNRASKESLGIVLTLDWIMSKGERKMVCDNQLLFSPDEIDRLTSIDAILAPEHASPSDYVDVMKKIGLPFGENAKGWSGRARLAFMRIACNIQSDGITSLFNAGEANMRLYGRWKEFRRDLVNFEKYTQR